MHGDALASHSYPPVRRRKLTETLPTGLVLFSFFLTLGVGTLCVSAAFDGVAESYFVGVFDGGADGEASGEAGDAAAERGKEFGEVHHGGLAVDVWRKSEDHFADLRVGLEAFAEFTDTQNVRCDAFDGIESSSEHVIATSECSSGFDCGNIP